MSKADKVINLMGDAITDMFEQLVKGSWTDDHGHDVQMNAAMIACSDAVIKAMEYRQRKIADLEERSE